MRNKIEKDVRRYLVKIYGIVQGVGFRPYVYKKAKEYQIQGWVENTGGAVGIDCTGFKDNIKHFLLDIIKKPPSLSKIEKVECTDMTEKLLFNNNDINRGGFEIKQSSEEQNKVRFVSPDVSVCSKCLEDIKKKNTSRYRYAFTNCTECGPRYSIIKGLPYDRPRTVMENFHMCEDCQKEYDNPLNRRFHAQPNCCEKCGPTLLLLDNKGEQVECNDIIEETIKLLMDGKILAIKGIGGFHLVCDGKNEKTVLLLRARKHRRDKPLALMAKDINTIKEFCYVSEKEEEVLTSSKRPIVLLKKKCEFLLPYALAAKQKKLGVMLPYTPLHHLLFNEKLNLLVMTSGNISGMPIEYKNEEALKHLGKAADFFLVNNRDIYIPIDDSVVKVIDEEEIVSRRARGYTPYNLKVDTKLQIIALGGEQKNSICVSKNGYSYLSQYLGDLKEFECYENFKYVLKHFIKLFNINPDVIVHDIHPSYLSTQFAISLKGRKIAVQHHHAHMVSCMAEHSIDDIVIGIIFDGTGFGLDGAVWGGEFFIGNREFFKRAGHLEYVNIQGGDKAVKEPWRCAASYLYSLNYKPSEIIQDVAKESIEVVLQALNSDFNCFLSSSIGRLFDAVASLIGIRNYISYDGQAAIELENIIDKEIEESYPWNVEEREGIFHLQYKGIIEGILKDVKEKELASKISAKFHNSLAEASCYLVCRVRENEGINKVVLSGGVFENEYLLKKIYINLRKKGFQVFFNKQIPINDGGISFGQLNAASAIIKKGR
ncbi:carbamoyltransferase HypF [Clostridium sp. SYSU_GA19001]|uniref:carbamoyltransferase HypF n=1 Tax=Clostridium caldaquaticum TaxID=2940653 RepID=UPI002076FCB3|nr:carbamoyltransferase HypF [Clostridium caldaquaticum]